MVQVILVSYSGYPYTISSLIPDNSLANLAGELVKAGNNVLILDYNTPYSMKRLVSSKMQQVLQSLSDKISLAHRDPSIKKQFEFVDSELNNNKKSYARELFKDIESKILQTDAKVIGFKLWLGDGFPICINLAENIKKKFKNIKIIAGGPQISLFRELIYEKSDVFDALVYGEGEEIINELVDRLVNNQDLKDIPNLIYKRNGKIITTDWKPVENFDKLSFPLYEPEIYPSLYEGGKLKIFAIDESRGCPRRCKFCCHTFITGKKRRIKPIDRFIKEVRYLIDRYDAKAIRLGGSSTPIKFFREFAQELTKNGIRIPYSAFASPSEAVKLDMKMLKDSGCFGLFFGLETADERIRREIMGKYEPIDLVFRTLRSCIENDIFTVTSIIYPTPGENGNSSQATYRFLVDLYKGREEKGSVLLNPPGLFPHTVWYNEPEKYGFRLHKEKRQYLLDSMNYEIKSILPFTLWEPLPYDVNGKGMIETMFLAYQFAKKLEEENILTMLHDEVAMIGSLAGYNPPTFKRLMEKTCYLGMWEVFEDVIDKINNN